MKVQKNCKFCKYYEVFYTPYCSKQNHRIYHPELGCKYFKLGFLDWLIFVVFSRDIELTDNCKE